MDKTQPKSNNKSPLRVLLISSSDQGSGWGTYTNNLYHGLKDAGGEIFIEHIDSPIRFKKNLILSPFYALKFFAKYRGVVDIVHCIVEPYAFITILVSKLLHVPYVLTFHGTYSVSMLNRPILGLLQRTSYSKARKIVAVSNYTEKRALELCPDLEIEVIPNGIGPIGQHTIRNLSQNKIILSVGAVKHRKGYHLVIESLSKIRKNLEPFKYYIVGDLSDVNYVNKLKFLISKYSLEDYVEFKGKVPDQDLSDLYDKADVFVLTPVSESSQFEGFGLVYLEANARGVPVVGMKGSGAEEAINDGYNGFLANRLDVADLGDKIVLALNKDTYNELSKNSLDWVKMMSLDNMVLKYIDLYKK